MVVGNSTSPPAVQPTTNSVQIFTYAEAVPVAIVVVGLAIFIFLHIQDRRRRNNGRNGWRIFFCSEAVPLLEEEVRDVEIEHEDPASERTAAKSGAQESRGDGSSPAQEMFEAPCQTLPSPAAAMSTTADPEQECESEQSVWRQATAAPDPAQERESEQSVWRQDSPLAKCRTVSPSAGWATALSDAQCQTPPSSAELATAARDLEKERESEQSVWGQDSSWLAECRTVSPPAGWATAFSEAQCQTPPSSAELATAARDLEKERESEQSVWGQDSSRLAECRTVSPPAGWATAFSEVQCQIPPSSAELAIDAQDPEKERESEQSVWGQDSSLAECRTVGPPAGWAISLLRTILSVGSHVRMFFRSKFVYTWYE